MAPSEEAAVVTSRAGSRPAGLILRAGQARDAAACGAICYQAFKSIAERHNFPPDFPSAEAAQGLLADILGMKHVYAVVAEFNGRVVGSNFLWGPRPIAGVGPITIDPAVQNGGVGRSLMEDVLDRARHDRFAGVRLVQAAYHSRSLALYTKLGFAVREPLCAVQGPPLAVTIPGHAVRKAAAPDIQSCAALHAAIHGFDRTVELCGAVERGSATVVERNGRISGYATDIGFFGHTVGAATDDLKALIGAAHAFSGPGFLVPLRNGELLRWCVAHGLRIVQPMTLMSLGLYNEPLGAFLPSILY
jgi:GNAT superfamily N-acetyltransferase